MATRTAAKAAPRNKQASAKRAATAKPKAAPASRKRGAPKTDATKKPAARKPSSKKTATAPAQAPSRTGKASSPRRTPARSSAGKARTSRAPKPKAMEVSYSGRIFRSRLEARWAIFLDLLDVNWDYEPSFYQVGEELFYLPDFYLPDHQLWLEVKGAPYMDTASMAKVLAAVAGPQRIPLREAPYTPSDRLLLGGPFKAQKHGLMPVHTLITPAGPGVAALSSAAFGIEPDGRASLNVLGAPWDTLPATGVKAARRPTPARLQLLLEPEPQLRASTVPERIARAYNGAYRLAFDDQTKTVCDQEVLAAVSRRRSGRPLGLAA
ncbi:hypothetical protein Achl_3949 (plasmid) [Pseudarthrobacter chlorophenolicus A6]|uniref:Uncharacterized protein n=1 Tax=Pseudarthrobacter chlorophenolicus (strain ATCC 700700 / DSM 12829 / CIP 107037 / JCM 12360 / KCTC 9906 / NCIMB 13794 / A6) TaxID=452863 RepID=B8HHK3_PSECP|nr:hypothetical protein [Pseudarthrobacter chlorophenolicus]ACL41900.1 hypothetical protein Achl_3949 [Pseudarthrobacter chlorophenolicus A6]SDQ18378.1 hypothetical protein SAMN04489738_0561 [Pseudarthrobacter chlorophenolicus]